MLWVQASRLLELVYHCWVAVVAVVVIVVVVGVVVVVGGVVVVAVVVVVVVAVVVVDMCDLLAADIQKKVALAEKHLTEVAAGM